MLRLKVSGRKEGKDFWICIDDEVEAGKEGFYGYGETPIDAYITYKSLVISYVEVYPESKNDKDIKYVLENCMENSV